MNELERNAWERTTKAMRTPDIRMELWLDGEKWTVRWDAPGFQRTFEGLTLSRAYDEVSDNLLTTMRDEVERQQEEEEDDEQ